ncbi:unnamed protein product [Phytophthora fragariaefolia]|uniref:Unnamed protein product n=1 Tax=Phytophthora fragariaefolia TaxID=1490495 RepID=A0A9W6XUQ6_9STRA|nr:unnamed protein product [Phytophthora fragariaefolia]
MQDYKQGNLTFTPNLSTAHMPNNKIANRSGAPEVEDEAPAFNYEPPSINSNVPAFNYEPPSINSNYKVALIHALVNFNVAQSDGPVVAAAYGAKFSRRLDEAEDDCASTQHGNGMKGEDLHPIEARRPTRCAMKGAVLKRVPGGRPGKKKKDTTKLGSSPTKVLFRDPIGHELPPSLQNFRWNVDKVERKLQEKIQEKTLIAGNFVYQQAYRLLEGTRGEGIDFPSFREQLRVKFGIILDDSELHLLFDKYDEDGNGTIDLHEFIRRVLPPDYNYGRQWFEISQLESEQKAARLRHEARQEFLACQNQPTTEEVDNMGTTSSWTIDTLMKQIQAKVVQKTPSGEDQYRRAFKMLRTGRDQGIRMNGLQFNLRTKFGIYASDEQMRQLFSLCDQDSNGEIDLKEFLQFVDPPAYPANSKSGRSQHSSARLGIFSQHRRKESCELSTDSHEKGAPKDCQSTEDAHAAAETRNGRAAANEECNCASRPPADVPDVHR